jgi:hypothetical protein
MGFNLYFLPYSGDIIFFKSQISLIYHVFSGNNLFLEYFSFFLRLPIFLNIFHFLDSNLLRELGFLRKWSIEQKADS